MAHKPEHIDNVFRDRLQEAAVPPPAFIWDNIEVKLRKRRRRFLFWIFTFGIAGAGALGIWLSNGTSNTQNQSGIEPVLNVTEISQESNTGSPENISRTNDKRNVAAQEIAEKNRILPVKNTAQFSKSPGLPARAVSPLSVNSNPQSSAPSSAATENSGLETSVQVAAAENQQARAITLPDLLPLLPPGQFTTASDKSPSAGDVRALWPKSLKTHTSKAKAKKAVKNCYDFAKQPNAWMADIYVGPSLAQRELISTSLDDKPYLNKRLSTERRDLAFNAGVRVSLMLKGNFLIRTGLHYDQMTERFEYIDPKYVITHVANVYHPDTGLTTLDTTGVEYGENYQKTYNRFGMLDIPLAVGVELRKGRSGFNFNAGMTINLLFWKRGAIISPETGGPVWFTPDQKGAADIFRPNSGLSATASVQWFYHLKPRLRIFVEPSFRKMLRPVTLPSHPVEQRYGIGGLRFGLTKILN